MPLSPMKSLIVFVKNPIPSTVKTCLQTRYAPEQVTAFYIAFMHDVLERPGGGGQGTHPAGLRGGRDRTRQGRWAAGNAHGGVERRQGSHTVGWMGSGERTRRG